MISVRVQGLLVPLSMTVLVSSSCLALMLALSLTTLDLRDIPPILAPDPTSTCTSACCFVGKEELLTAATLAMNA